MIQTIHPSAKLSGVVPLPGDKSISHRYAMLAAIAEGTSELRHFAASQDCHSTLRCLKSVGVEISEVGDLVTIKGRGLRGLVAPKTILDAGNSGTTIRLFSGILAGQDFESAITGDASLSRRPMRRILEPLRLMGAGVSARAGDLPPLTIRGAKLHAVRYELPVASAQVKSCVLLAGLYASGTTAVKEALATRDHTEIALRHFGARVRSSNGWIEVETGPALKPLSLDIPADLSGAAFFLIAAALIPDSEIFMPAVGLNPGRRELLRYLQSAGLDVSIEHESEGAGEPRGDLRVHYSPALLECGLPAVSGSLVPLLIDEIPVLAILGSQCRGGVEIKDAHELRVKESDRIAALARNLQAMGATVEERPDGLRIPGCQRLRGTDIDTRGDHRIAMAFGVAALTASSDTRIHQAECADVSFPGFWEALKKVCGGQI